MIGLGTKTHYFRSSYRNIKCPYCSSHFSANKERVRHINWDHLGEYNETTEEFNKGIRLIDVSKLSEATRKDLKSIILPPESCESPVSLNTKVVTHNAKVVKHNTKVTKKKTIKKKISPNSLPGAKCSVSSSVPDIGNLISSVPRASVIMSSRKAPQSPQMSADVSRQEVVAVPDSNVSAQLSQPSQSLISPLQGMQELSDSLAPYRRQMEVIYNESFIPNDLNSCQVLLRELLRNHLDMSQLALFPDIVERVTRQSL